MAGGTAWEWRGSTPQSEGCVAGLTPGAEGRDLDVVGIPVRLCVVPFTATESGTPLGATAPQKKYCPSMAQTLRKDG
jgi:hypothetical protein